jgi:hypothetical protein
LSLKTAIFAREKDYLYDIIQKNKKNSKKQPGAAF